VIATCRGPVAATSFFPVTFFFASALASTAFAADTVVSGSANPNLAGRPTNSTCCNGDAVPGQAPPLVMGQVFGGCDELEFNVTGKVSFLGGDVTGNNPDGDTLYDMVNYGDGISAPKQVKTNALVGVFLDENSPTGKTTPAQLDFSSGLAFFSLGPELGQIFFIGDGRTSDSAAFAGSSLPRIPSTIQRFLVPPGTKRLFLGTVDGEGWFNNSGAFTVETVVYPYEIPTACGDAADPTGLFASDALAVLRGAVGSGSCSECYCDVDHSGKVVAGDALAVLRHAVGQNVDLECPCCTVD
jgi:hypothetical protein